MKSLIIFVMLCFNNFSLASISDIYSVQGTITSFNKDKVELKTKNNTLVIPRSVIKNGIFKVGEKVNLNISKKNFNQVRIKIK